MNISKTITFKSSNNRDKVNILLLVFILSFVNVLAQNEDESADIVTDLDELVVTSERSWIEGNKAVFIPSSKEKNLSYDAVSLLQSMNLPMIRISGSDVSDISGNAVVIFINGIRANNIDLAAFWPKQAIRVEYIKNSDDPRFDGCSEVINFIMPVYLVGGVSKFDASQTIPNSGFYQAASMLAYKSMTFGARLMASYERDHRSHSVANDKYSDFFYNGDYYDELFNHYTDYSWKREQSFNVSLNARYIKTGFNATHSVIFHWQDNPGSGSIASNEWDKNLFNGYSSCNNFSGKYISPLISGNYMWSVTDKFHLSGKWSYSFSKNDYNTSNVMGSSEVIEYSSDEQVHSGNLSFLATYMINKRIYVQGRVVYSIDEYLTSYHDKLAQDARQLRHNSDFRLTAGYNPLNNLRMNAWGGVNYSKNVNANLNDNVDISPIGSFNISYSPTRKVSLSGRASYTVSFPNASYTDNVIVRESQLIWNSGNPNLKPEYFLDCSINCLLMPAYWIEIYGLAAYYNIKNSVSTLYVPRIEEFGGFLKSNINSQNTDLFKFILPVTARLLNNNLTITCEPRFEHICSNNLSKSILNNFSYSGKVSYSIKNCRFALEYQSKRSTLSYDGCTITKIPDSCNFSFDYGQGDFYVGISVNDIFHNLSRSYIVNNYGYRYTDKTSYKTGRCINIYLSYTIGYGKKVDPSINIDTYDEVKSGIVK